MHTMSCLAVIGCRLVADTRPPPFCQATTRHGGRSSPSSQASWFQVPATKKQMTLKNFR
jgi:hypothetical protein